MLYADGPAKHCLRDRVFFAQRLSYGKTKIKWDEIH